MCMLHSHVASAAHYTSWAIYTQRKVCAKAAPGLASSSVLRRAAQAAASFTNASSAINSTCGNLLSSIIQVSTRKLSCGKSGKLTSRRSRGPEACALWKDEPKRVPRARRDSVHWRARFGESENRKLQIVPRNTAGKHRHGPLLGPPHTARPPVGYAARAQSSPVKKGCQAAWWLSANP